MSDSRLKTEYNSLEAGPRSPQEGGLGFVEMYGIKDDELLQFFAWEPENKADEPRFGELCQKFLGHDLSETEMLELESFYEQYRNRTLH